MRSFSIRSSWKLVALALVALLLVACGHGRSKPDVIAAADAPAGFDVTLVAAKDNQFDYEGAPLTIEDLRSALRYRQEQSLPMATVLLKRAEKQKIKNEHIIALARIAFQMKFKAYMEDDGQVSEIRAQLKDPENEPAKSEPAPKQKSE
jgi:cellulose biosynthesis protein BcsQ